MVLLEKSLVSARLHQFYKTNRDGVVLNPCQKRIQLIIVPTLHGHRIDLDGRQPTGKSPLNTGHHFAQPVMAGNERKGTGVKTVHTDIDGINARCQPVIDTLIHFVAIGGHGHFPDAGHLFYGADNLGKILP